MEIVELSHNDSLVSVIRKCNVNFKQITWLISSLVKKQSRTDMGHTEEMINDIHNDITRMVDTVIPGEVSSQIQQQDIPGKVSNEVSGQLTALDIPTMVADEVTTQMSVAFPPVGSYVISMADPSASYQGTTWQQVDSITTDGSAMIPLWERVS